jgi:hypothetical protein
MIYVLRFWIKYNIKSHLGVLEFEICILDYKRRSHTYIYNVAAVIAFNVEKIVMAINNNK